MSTDYLLATAMFLASLLLGLLVMRPNTKLRVSIAAFSFEIERREGEQSHGKIPNNNSTITTRSGA